jgi:protein-tyrosine kinase
MSRIHEALRKAERERGERPSPEVPSIVATTPTETPTAAPVSVPPPQPGQLPSPQAKPEATGIDALRQRCAQPEWKLGAKRAVFTEDGSSSVAAEQFRSLRSRLYRFREKHPCRTILVTSSLPAEGKTFVAANLAQAIVRQHERRALLIDADLRASRLHLEIGAPSTPGLSEYLRGEADEFAVIQSSADGNLLFIPGGKTATNPTELLAGPRLRSLLDRMASWFDWVILDSPPVLPVADAGLLADLCDGVLLVVRSGSTPYDAAKKARMEFREKNVIGAVLNRAEEIKPYSSYYYHYYGDGKK